LPSYALLFATSNPFKARLFRPILAAHGIDCLTLADAGLSLTVEETGRTPEENALLKARAVHSGRWPLVLGVDAALEIDALDGAPGVRARRWAGHLPDDVGDGEWLAHLLAQLAGIPLEQRTARWHSAWAVITPDGREHVRHHRRRFVIAESPIRPIVPGSPMAAVEVGRSEANLRAQIAADWDRWDIWSEIARSTAGS
jgi:XTP/dITP diphosphohydrolase